MNKKIAFLIEKVAGEVPSPFFDPEHENYPFHKEVLKDTAYRKKILEDTFDPS